MSEPAWIVQQTKAFLGWLNGIVAQRELHANSIDDLTDGFILWNLMELLTSRKLAKAKKDPKTKIQRIENVAIVFDCLKKEKIKLVNISAEDVETGNKKIILGLLFTLILHYHVSIPGITSEEEEKKEEVHEEKDEEEEKRKQEERDKKRRDEAKKELLIWVNSVTVPEGVEVVNFNSSWADGKAFVALVNGLEPGAISPGVNPVENMNTVFDYSHTVYKIPKLLDAELVNKEPDDLSIVTYVSYFRIKQGEILKRAGARVDPSQSSVTNIPPSVPQDHLVEYLVQLKDTEGQPLIKFQRGFTVEVQTPEGAEKAPKINVKDNNDGTYFVEYFPRKSSGYYEFKVLTRLGEIITNGNFSVAVGKFFKDSHVKFHSPTVFIGEVVSMEIVLKDQNGDPLMELPKDFKIEVGGVETLVTDLKKSEDGVWIATYTPLQVGEYTSQVKVNGQIVGQIFTFHAIHRVDSKKSTFECPQEIYLGDDLDIVVTPRDSNGNPSVGENLYKIEVLSPSGKPVKKPEELGEYKVKVVNDQGIIIGNEVTVTVKSIPLDISKTEISNYKSEIQVNDLEKFSLKFYNIRGDPYKETVQVRVVISNSEHEISNPKFESGNVSYKATHPGTYKVLIYINDKLWDHPLELHVSEPVVPVSEPVAPVSEPAAPVSEPVTPVSEPVKAEPAPVEKDEKISENFMKVIDKGAKTYEGEDETDDEVLKRVIDPNNTQVSVVESGFLIKTFNAQGKRIRKGGHPITAKLTGDGQTRTDLHDNKDGTYLMRFRPNHEVTYNFEVRFNAEEIKGSPFLARIHQSKKDIIKRSEGLKVALGLLLASWGLKMEQEFDLKPTKSSNS